MHSSKCDEIIRTEFSGAPIRGKRGGFSTGPQEHLALVGMGMERFNSEITHLRSDFCGVEMEPIITAADYRNKNDDNGSCEIVGASSTFKRINDDLNLRELNVVYKATKHVDTVNLSTEFGATTD